MGINSRFAIQDSENNASGESIIGAPEANNSRDFLNYSTPVQ
jgi:hypothetical protein